MEDLKLNITSIEKDIVIRTGEAEIIREKQNIELAGDINAPAEFDSKRKSEYDKLQCHVIVDKENSTIKLVVNERDFVKTTISGRLQLFTELSALKINENKTYSPRELYDTLKFSGAYFKNREQHAALCDKLTKFTGRIESDFVNSNDFKGNVAHSKLTKIKTDLDLKFTLAIPIYKGSEPSVFDVDICLDSKDGGVICWLESVEMHELKTKISGELIDGNIAKLSDYVIINI